MTLTCTAAQPPSLVARIQKGFTSASWETKYVFSFSGCSCVWWLADSAALPVILVLHNTVPSRYSRSSKTLVMHYLEKLDHVTGALAPAPALPCRFGWGLSD